MADESGAWKAFSRTFLKDRTPNSPKRVAHGWESDSLVVGGWGRINGYIGAPMGSSIAPVAHDAGRALFSASGRAGHPTGSSKSAAGSTFPAGWGVRAVWRPRLYTAFMTRMGEPGFEIVKAKGVCTATGRPIAVGDEFIAALVETADGNGMERQDFSLDAWQGGARPQPIAKLFGAWKTTMLPPSEKKRVLVDDESLFDLFEQLQEATEPARVSFRYILALLLMRRKLLKYEVTRRAESPKGLVMQVRRATKADEAPMPIIDVIDPGMDEQAIADAIEQLGAVIASGPSGGPA